MPRPSKPIHPGRSLDAPVTPSRQRLWSKYGEQMPSNLPYSPEAAASQESPEVEVVVDDITVVEHAEPALTVVRPVPELAPEPEVSPAPEPYVERVKEWKVVRSIHGRMYRRTDTAVWIEVASDATQEA